MAINLWKLAGRKTEYNPLPSDWTNNLYLNIGDYDISFKAKSQSNSRLNVVGSGGKYIGQILPLNTTLTEYKFSVNWLDYRYLAFYALDSSTDIVIEDIKVVETPTGKATINGIDGFLSGRWDIHENARVVDDETLELNAVTNGYEDTRLAVPVKPNTEYTFSGEGNGRFIIVQRVRAEDTSNVTVNNATIVGNLNLTFTTHETTRYVIIDCVNPNSTVGKFTFKRPRLNLGSSIAPYTKKTGDRMVMPVVSGKNLFDGIEKSVIKTPTVSTIRDIKVKPNTSYVYRCHIDNSLGTTKTRVRADRLSLSGSLIEYGNADFVEIGQKGYSTGSLKTGLNEEFLRFGHQSSTNFSGESIATEFQLEEGTLLTEFEPYAVQMNEKPKVKVPKKNILPPFTDSRWSIHSNAKIISPYELELNATTNSQSNDIVIDCLPSQVYTIQATFNGRFGVWARDINGNTVGTLVSYLDDGTEKTISDSFTTPSNTRTLFVGLHNQSDITNTKKLSYVMLSKSSSSSTPFEPFELITPRAEKGLAFDGVDDCVTVENSSNWMNVSDWQIDIDVLFNSFNSSPRAVLTKRSVLSEGALFYLSESGGLAIDILGYSARWATTWVAEKNRRYNLSIRYKDGTCHLFVDGTLHSSRVMPNHSDTFSNVVIGANEDKTKYNLDAVFYSIKYLENGEVMAEYDFTNPNNIVGDKIIQNAENLISSFEDERWSLHSDFRVLGKDVGRLEATAIQTSDLILKLKPDTEYFAEIKGNGLMLARESVTETTLFSSLSDNSISFRTNGSTEDVYIRLYSNKTGSFDFIKPKLYEVSSLSGTIAGKPIQKLKAPKRKLFAKR